MTRCRPIILLLALLGGCASLEPPATSGTAEAACHALFVNVDAAIHRAGLRDEGDHAVPGFPYLRSNRLLAALAGRTDTPARARTWLEHLGDLDARAREFELRRHGEPIAGMEDDALQTRLDQCRSLLVARDLGSDTRMAALHAASRVADDYLRWRRITGLYVITAPLFTLGINEWHRETREIFATALAELPRGGRLQRWTSGDRPPPTPDAIGEWTGDRDALGFPRLDHQRRQALFAHFAPIWEVDVVDDNDRIGALRWQGGALVDTALPVEYRLLSHTLLNGEVAPQLNYIVWFPARPGSDILAGWLDGIIWRVTLGPDGRPVLYDSIHACGCYHLFFPTAVLAPRDDLRRWYLEKPLIPQQAPPGERVVIRVSSVRHYIERVYEAGDAQPATIALRPEHYDTLRALPGASGWHSVFDRHGLIDGSERPERFLFWPMGIRSPGAMRQYGRHPTAFVGRRHFDDPHLIDSLFRRARR